MPKGVHASIFGAGEGAQGEGRRRCRARGARDRPGDRRGEPGHVAQLEAGPREDQIRRRERLGPDVLRLQHVAVFRLPLQHRRGRRQEQWCLLHGRHARVGRLDGLAHFGSRPRVERRPPRFHLVRLPRRHPGHHRPQLQVGGQPRDQRSTIPHRRFLLLRGSVVQLHLHRDGLQDRNDVRLPLRVRRPDVPPRRPELREVAERCGGCHRQDRRLHRGRVVPRRVAPVLLPHCPRHDRQGQDRVGCTSTPNSKRDIMHEGLGLPAC
mmetsp:Transcript_121650/g.389425  ORF Transcript_121650/g.389425 Transcript_121650/m.389425 type:complete len:266 (-) Transcript_121650:125-922(-)